MARGPARGAGRVILLLTGIVLSACGSDPIGRDDIPPQPDARDTTVISVDLAATRQRIDGFGGTTLPLVYPTGDFLGSHRAAAIKAAFGDVGISLGALQPGIVETPRNATNPWEQRGNDNADPFVIDPAGFNFGGSDVIRESILTPARAHGYEDVTLGPILNLSGVLSWMQQIRRESYDRYLDEAAEHVLAIMLHWRDAYGVVPPLLHLFNEPTSGNTELASRSTQEVVDLVGRVGQRLSAAGFRNVKFIVPNEETIGRSRDVAAALLADPTARPYVGVIGYHPYPYGSTYASPRRILETSGSGAPDPSAVRDMTQLRALAEQYGVPVWMTEVSEGPGSSDYPYASIENVLARAVHIHDNFEYAGASAFFGMNTIWDSRSHEEHFAGRNVPFLSEQSSIVLADVTSGRMQITGMGYAIGQYARWVPRGSTWVAAQSDTDRVIASAFRDAARNRVVVVAVNTDTSPRLLRIRLSGASARGTVRGEQSYEQERWAPVAAFAPSSPSEVQLVARARSVTTLAIPL